MHFSAWSFHETEPENIHDKLYVWTFESMCLDGNVVGLLPMNINVLSREWEEI